jgi:hypothetical protein
MLCVLLLGEPRTQCKIDFRTNTPKNVRARGQIIFKSLYSFQKLRITLDMSLNPLSYGDEGNFTSLDYPRI